MGAQRCPDTRVVEEVVLDHEHLVEPERFGQLRDATLVRHVLGVGQGPAVVLEDELEGDVHAAGSSTGGAGGPNPWSEPPVPCAPVHAT